jgi:hypothetical protein
LLADNEVKTLLKEKYQTQCAGIATHLTRGNLERTVGGLAANDLSAKLCDCAKNCYWQVIKSIESISLRQQGDVGKGCHTRSTEPYFYDTAYEPVVRNLPISVNNKGECVVATEIPFQKDSEQECAVAKGVESPGQDESTESDSVEECAAHWKKWECSKECKPLSDFEVAAILLFRVALELSVVEARQALAKCD